MRIPKRLLQSVHSQMDGVSFVRRQLAQVGQQIFGGYAEAGLDGLILTKPGQGRRRGDGCDAPGRHETAFPDPVVVDMELEPGHVPAHRVRTFTLVGCVLQPSAEAKLCNKLFDSFRVHKCYQGRLVP